MLRTCAELEGLAAWERFALMVAAVAHDVAHRGVSNQFLVQVRDDLALLYNDESVQEAMHASTLFQVGGGGCGGGRGGGGSASGGEACAAAVREGAWVAQRWRYDLRSAPARARRWRSSSPDATCLGGSRARCTSVCVGSSRTASCTRTWRVTSA